MSALLWTTRFLTQWVGQVLCSGLQEPRFNPNIFLSWCHIKNIVYVEKITTWTIQIKELLLLFLMACPIPPTHLGWSVQSASCMLEYLWCTYQNILKHQKMYLTVVKTTSKYIFYQQCLLKYDILKIFQRFSMV